MVRLEPIPEGEPKISGENGRSVEFLKSVPRRAGTGTGRGIARISEWPVEFLKRHDRKPTSRAQKMIQNDHGTRGGPNVRKGIIA